MAKSYIQMCQSNNIKFYFVFCIPHPPLRYCKSFDFHLVASEWVVEIDRSSEISHPVVCHCFKVPLSKPQIDSLGIDRSSENLILLFVMASRFQSKQINRSFLDPRSPPKYIILLSVMASRFH